MKRPFLKQIIIGSFFLLLVSCTKDRLLEQNNNPDTPSNPNTTDSLAINEFLAMGSLLASDVGVTCDWIELYNNSENTFTINPGEWFISDSPTDLEKFELPQRNIPPGGYLLLFCDDDGTNTIPANSPFIHLTFSLSSTSGESIVLSHKVNDTTSIVDQIDFLAQTEANMSNARIPNGTGNWAYPVTPTPGATNQ